jgi:hypothetical protein
VKQVAHVQARLLVSSVSPATSVKQSGAPGAGKKGNVLIPLGF